MATRIYKTDGPDPREVPEGAVNLYVLFDETTQTAFYAGITSDTMRRARQHWHTPGTPQQARLQSVLKSGGECSMLVVASFESRGPALAAEAALHEAHPVLMGSGRQA